jgi:hypothetical protein
MRRLPDVKRRYAEFCADVGEEFFREPSLVWRLDVSFEGELEIFEV